MFYAKKFEEMKLISLKINDCYNDVSTAGLILIFQNIVKEVKVFLYLK
jgi:hypothetical protein